MGWDGLFIFYSFVVGDVCGSMCLFAFASKQDTFEDLALTGLDWTSTWSRAAFLWVWVSFVGGFFLSGWMDGFCLLLLMGVFYYFPWFKLMTMIMTTFIYLTSLPPYLTD